MTQAAIMPEWMQQRLGGTTLQPGEIELAPDELTPFELFVALGTQWQYHPMGGRTGINYAAIRPTADLSGITVTPSVFTDLRVMELAALDAFAEAAAK